MATLVLRRILSDGTLSCKPWREDAVSCFPYHLLDSHTPQTRRQETRPHPTSNALPVCTHLERIVSLFVFRLKSKAAWRAHARRSQMLNMGGGTRHASNTDVHIT